MSEAGSIALFTAILSFIGTVISGVIALYMVRISSSAKITAVNSEETKKSAEAQAVSLEKVHVAVNSERTDALAEIRGLRDEILRISLLNTQLVEAAVSAGRPAPPSVKE